MAWKSFLQFRKKNNSRKMNLEQIRFRSFCVHLEYRKYKMPAPISGPFRIGKLDPIPSIKRHGFDREWWLFGAYLASGTQLGYSSKWIGKNYSDFCTIHFVQSILLHIQTRKLRCKFANVYYIDNYLLIDLAFYEIRQRVYNFP